MTGLCAPNTTSNCYRGGYGLKNLHGDDDGWLTGCGCRRCVQERMATGNEPSRATPAIYRCSICADLRCPHGMDHRATCLGRVRG